MGWSDAYNYLRNGAAKLVANEGPRTDGDLPLGARIDSVVGIQQSPLLRAAGAGSLITLPDASDTRIVAVSQIRLKQSGEEDFLIFEQAEAVGGTWRDNHYPGCACDVQSHVYSFSFAPNPDWTRQFAPQAEIRA